MKYLRVVIKYNPKAAIVDQEKGEIDLSVNTERLTHLIIQAYDPKTGEPVGYFKDINIGPRGGVNVY